MRSERNANISSSTAPTLSAGSFYSLWDVESMNSLGTYESRDDVVGIVRALLDANGLAYADLLDISIEDKVGNIEHVATGDELIELVGFPHRTGTH